MTEIGNLIGILRVIKNILPELLEQGITYTPLCFRSFGRVHSEAIRWLEYSSRAAARRRGVADYRPILNRWFNTEFVRDWTNIKQMTN